MANKEKKELYILAASPVGNGLSGGDRIFIELARNAARMNIETTVISWKAGFEMCRKTDLFPSRNLKFLDLQMEKIDSLGFAFSYIGRILKACIWSLNYSFSNKDLSSVILYSASDFWMDVIPAVILKLRFSKIKWVGTFYLAAPSPFKGYKEEGEWKLPTLKGVIYWLMQMPMYWLIRVFSEFVFVTSEPDIKRFPRQAKTKRVIVIKGGVDLDKVRKFEKQIGNVKKTYDAVFMGRFHPQKGVLELIDIWKIVVESLPAAKLVMIGDGPLMPEVKKKIEKLHLENNIEVTGYLIDGLEKYTIFAKSKIVVHPAIYDSGGMAAAEAMAWGLPGVSFDLEALKTYYPKGMLKVPLHNNKRFALIVLELLSHKNLYEKTKKESLDLITQYWNWQKRAEESINAVLNL